MIRAMSDFDGTKLDVISAHHQHADAGLVFSLLHCCLENAGNASIT